MQAGLYFKVVDSDDWVNAEAYAADPQNSGRTHPRTKDSRSSDQQFCI